VRGNDNATVVRMSSKVTIALLPPDPG
jgi:hypothetical protein